MARQPAQLGQLATLQPSEPPDQASPLALASPLVSLLASPWQAPNQPWPTSWTALGEPP